MRHIERDMALQTGSFLLLLTRRPPRAKVECVKLKRAVKGRVRVRESNIFF